MVKKLTRLKRLKNRGYHSLQKNGFRETVGKGLTVVQQNQPFETLSPYLKPLRNIKNGHLLQSESPPLLLKAKVISDQYNGDEFARYDLFAFIAGLEGNQELYSKVETHYDHLDPLETPALDKVDEFCSVKIQPNGKLIDIGYFAKHLVDNSYNAVPVKVVSSSEPSKITRNDLTKILDEDEIEIVDKTATKILKTSGYLFQSIIWPPGLQFQEDIEQRFSQQGNVLDIVELDLRDSFPSFVEDVYITQFAGRADLADQKEKIMGGVRNKRKIMENYGTRVRVLFVEIPDPKIREESAVMSETKLSCRENLKDRINEEKSSEIIVHCTDDFTHNLSTMKVLNRYTEGTSVDGNAIQINQI